MNKLNAYIPTTLTAESNIKVKTVIRFGKSKTDKKSTGSECPPMKINNTVKDPKYIANFLMPAF